MGKEGYRIYNKDMLNACLCYFAGPPGVLVTSY